MALLEESAKIAGVITAHLEPYADERGRFLETFRKEWFPQRTWDIFQVNRSDSRAGVLRGLHYHHQQVDYWHVLRGKLRVGLADLRSSSDTYLATAMLEISQASGLGLFIPNGVAHGFLALTDVTLTYVVDNYHNGGRDEFGIAWDDPDLGLSWGATKPLISTRDRSNPRLREIAPEKLPR